MVFKRRCLKYTIYVTIYNNSWIEKYSCFRIFIVSFIFTLTTILGLDSSDFLTDICIQTVYELTAQLFIFLYRAEADCCPHSSYYMNYFHNWQCNPALKAMIFFSLWYITLSFKLNYETPFIWLAPHRKGFNPVFYYLFSLIYSP